MELAWCIGIALGPICASVFFYIGGYSLPFYVVGVTILVCLPFIQNLQLQEEEEGEAPQFMTALMNYVWIF
jgi:MFS family permease